MRLLTGDAMAEDSIMNLDEGYEALVDKVEKALSDGENISMDMKDSLEDSKDYE